MRINLAGWLKSVITASLDALVTIIMNSAYLKGSKLDLMILSALNAGLYSQLTTEPSQESGQRFPQIELENYVLFSNNAAICRKTGRIIAPKNKDELKELQ